MSDLILRSCPICMGAIPFGQVLFMQCGHKACAVCISRLRRSQRGRQFPECPECRQPIVEKPHRIYLSISEVAGNTRHEEQRSQSGSVTSDLKDRITLFRRWEHVKKENDGLRDCLNAFYTEHKIATEKEKKARTVIQNEREKSQQLSEIVDNCLAALKKRDRDVANLNIKIEEYNKKKKENDCSDGLINVLYYEIQLANEKKKEARTTTAIQNAREELQRLFQIADSLTELTSRAKKWKK